MVPLTIFIQIVRDGRHQLHFSQTVRDGSHSLTNQYFLRMLGMAVMVLSTNIINYIFSKC